MGLRKCKAEISTPSISFRLVISVHSMLELHMPLRVTWIRGLVEVGLVSLRAEAGWRMVHREEPPLAGEYNLSLSLSPSATTREQWEKHHKQQLVSTKRKKLKVYGILNRNYPSLGAHKTDREV